MIVTQLGPSLARWFLWDTGLDLTDPVNASVFHLVCMQAMEDGFSECMKYLYGLVSSQGVSASAWEGRTETPAVLVRCVPGSCCCTSRPEPLSCRQPLLWLLLQPSQLCLKKITWSTRRLVDLCTMQRFQESVFLKARICKQEGLSFGILRKNFLVLLLFFFHPVPFKTFPLFS